MQSCIQATVLMLCFSEWTIASYIHHNPWSGQCALCVPALNRVYTTRQAAPHKDAIQRWHSPWEKDSKCLWATVMLFKCRQTSVWSKNHKCYGKWCVPRFELSGDADRPRRGLWHTDCLSSRTGSDGHVWGVRMTKDVTLQKAFPKPLTWNSELVCICFTSHQLKQKTMDESWQ